MDLQMTQVLDDETANDDNNDDPQVGILRVGTTEHSIVKGFTKIGRSPALCKIVVDDLTVSKVHAEIQAGCETAFISDVRSANGTKIKDVSLKPFFYYTINDGDAIYLGSVKAIFKTNKSAQNSDSTLPETPIPSRKFNETNTPRLGNASDFLFNNTSLNQSDDSAIPGTAQKSKKSSIFQEPSAPANRRRIGNRIRAESEKTNKETKSQDDAEFRDLHDLETQQFNAPEPSESDKSKHNDRATKSQDEVESADFHELETQKMDHDSILCQSRAQKKPRSEKSEQYFDDTNIYEAETQVLSPSTENTRAKNEKKINRSHINDSVASSARSYNSSGSFSRLLQISASPSPPPSPNPLDENDDVIQSQNLLEMCETPLLELEKKANGSGKSGESSKLKNSVTNDVANSQENSIKKSGINSRENIVDSEKPDPSNHVIAESDDESATDDDLDIGIANASPESKKFGVSAKPSDVIEDDSATDDEGHFESLAARSPPKEERKLSLKTRNKTTEDRKAEENLFDAETQRMDEKKLKLAGEKCRKETTDVREVEENISDAETQRMDPKKYKLGGAKFRKETTEIRDAGDNIFDAETQRMDDETSVDAAANRNRAIGKNTEVKANKIHSKTLQMELKIRDIGDNIFEAATQRTEQDKAAAVVAKKRRKNSEDREIVANVFDAETQQMELVVPKVSGAKKRRQIEEAPDDDTNIFEAATQRTSPESSRKIHANKLRELEKNREAKENIFDAETQQMDLEIGEIAMPKKRRQIAANSDIDANIFEAATQRMDDDISDLVRTKKRRDIVKPINDDTDIDLLPTQVLDVPTSTPVSRSRKWKEQQSKKSSSSKLQQDLYSMATQISNEWDDVVDDSSTEEFAVDSPKSGAKNMENKRDNQAEVISMSSSRSPKSKGQKMKRSLRLETKKDCETSPKQIIKNLEDSGGKKSSTRSAGGNSSSGDENTDKEENNQAVNLDETLMRNLGIILDQEANNQELADQSTEIMTQNLVDILRPTQSFEESKSRDSEDEIADYTRGTSSPKKKKKEKVRSPSTLGFVDGHAVGSSKFSDEDGPKAASTMRKDYKEDEEKNENNSGEPELSDFKGKREAEDTTTSTEGESSSSGAKRASKRVPKSTRSTNSKSKAVTKRGKESQEVEAILAATSKKNVPVVAKRPYVQVQLTRLDDSDLSQQSSVSDKVETPKTNRKRRATMTAKDVTPSASPASAKSRRTISEGLENRTSPKEQHKILLTGLKEEHTKLAKKLGGLVVSEPSKATVLITDKVRRTYKFLCAVARGLRVVSVNWLLESQKASRFLDCDDFILNDPAAEKLYKFELEKSLENARTKKFLQGYTIIVTPKVNQPEIHELKGMIEASGGKVLTRAPGLRAWNAKTVIVSREEDLTAINALLSKCPKTVKITVQSVEFILSGILRQEVNLVEHKLDIP